MNLAIIGEYVYINSHEESNISVYNKRGRLMTTFNSDASGKIQFSYPSTIADGGGKDHLYITLSN